MNPSNFRAKFTKKERAERRETARAELLKILAPGSEVFANQTKTAPSGMSRRIRLYVSVPSHEHGSTIRDITYYACDLLDISYNDSGARFDGCGMDFRFDFIYSVSYVLFADGYALKNRVL